MYISPRIKNKVVNAFQSMANGHFKHSFCFYFFYLRFCVPSFLSRNSNIDPNTIHWTFSFFFLNFKCKKQNPATTYRRVYKCINMFYFVDICRIDEIQQTPVGYDTTVRYYIYIHNTKCTLRTIHYWSGRRRRTHKTNTKTYDPIDRWHFPAHIK